MTAPTATRTRRLAVPEHYDLAGTLAPLVMNRHDPVARIGGHAAWWAARTPDGPGTLHLAREGGSLTATGFGAGASWVVDRADAVAGLRDDVCGFAALAETHPAVRHAWHHHSGLRMTASGRVFALCVPVILTQKVTGLEASRAWLAIARRFGEPAPGPLDGLLLPPDPDAVAATPYWEFHRYGVEQRRADALCRTAVLAARLDAAPDAATATHLLTSIPGIGMWTAAEVVRVAYGDPDAVTVGDYHLPNHVVYAMTGAVRAGKRDGSPGRISSADLRMLEVLEPFRPQRARVVQLLLASGAGAPRFGPRSPVRSFARF
ncbi:MAG TPA: DNA-3-methyladenine glycosylase 2 family protein [Micromonosporaceae bacterium]|nr:DNA-3-methyladenine glycosylase 2 family protein [Micromonosporaceae bacterium]